MLLIWRWPLAVAALLMLLSRPLVAADAQNFMAETRIRGVKVEGLPLSQSGDQIFLLARDGYLWDFRPDEATELRKTAPSFHAYSFAELRSALEREMAGKLEITSTAHYLVAHPRNQGKLWAKRFEELYNSFVHYFSVRGLQVQKPLFPLVAIVWTRHEDFVRYAQSQGTNLAPGVLGYYSPVTNRVTLFDAGAGKSDPSQWQQNAATAIHEATHQTAFNTGVHTRLAPPPRWAAEGLGMLFEARGVYDSRSYPAQGERINRDRLTQFRQYLTNGRAAGAFVEIVNSDRLFQDNPDAAYAEAWALSFFLSETRPRKYNEYLARTAGREAFSTYSAARRLADFTSAFGSDLKMLEANYLRFIAGLK